MNYATQNPIWNYQNTRTEKATAIAPTVKRVRQLVATTQRCTFLPKLKETETIQACSDKAKIERDFYSSLSLMAKQYNIQPKETRQFPFP